jgi:hypothetical protein
MPTAMVYPKTTCTQLAILLLSCLIAIRLQAQDRKAADVLYTDLPIADLSAFTLMHVNPYKIARPAGAKELAASLMCIAKSDVSNAIPGFAIDWAPYQTFDGNRMHGNRDTILAAYRKSLILRNLQLSFGGAQDSFASRLAVGISFVIFDHSDPSNDPQFAKSVLALMQGGARNHTPQETQQLLQDDFRRDQLDPFFEQQGLSPMTDSLLYRLFSFETGSLSQDSIRAAIGRKFGARLGFDRGFDTPKEHEVNKLIDHYLEVLQEITNLRQQDRQVLAILIAEKRKQFLREHWNAGILKIGLGNSWFAPDYNWSHLESNKFSVYAAWGIKAGKWGQGILFGQYARTFSQDIAERNRTSWVYGGRVIAGNYWVHGTIEAAFHTHTYGRLFGKIRNDVNTIRGAAGVEARVTNGLWVQVSVGVNGPYSDFAKNDGVVLAGALKYAFK